MAPARDATGGTIQRIDAARVGGRSVVVLRARVPGETLWLFAAAGSGVAWLDGEARERARAIVRAAEASGEEARWRSRLDGARIVAAGARGVRFERGDERLALVIGARGELTLLDEKDGQADLGGDVAEDASARLDALASSALAAGRDALRRALDKAKTRVARRAEAVRGDLARIAEAEAKAVTARLFVAEASRAPRGATAITIVDWSTGEAKTVEMKLDPARSARDQLEAIFKRARRLKEGARFGRQRLADAEAMLGALEAVAKEVEAANELAALAALAERAKKAAPKDFSMAAPAAAGKGPARAREAPRPPHRTFVAASGARILVGRGGEHNDALTFHVAKPHDLWLHAKNRAGAHVIVPLPKNASAPAEVLVDAAHLAAHFSDARDEAVVEIQYTPRRYLRKPRGSAAGFVVVDREKVLVLRREEERLRRLLEREEGVT